MDMKSLKSQLEQVQQEASALQLQLSSSQDERSSTKQEVTIVTNNIDAAVFLLFSFTTLMLCLGGALSAVDKRFKRATTS